MLFILTFIFFYQLIYRRENPSPPLIRRELRLDLRLMESPPSRLEGLFDFLDLFFLLPKHLDKKDIYYP